MKKSVLIMLILAIILLVVGLFAYKATHKQSENNVETVSPIGSAIQQAMYEEETPAVVNEEQKENPEEVEKTSKISVIKKAVKTVQRKLSHEQAPTVQEQKAKEVLVKENAAESDTRKFTPEEEELLKKVPRSEEVVVDKEIKVKSSCKYLFK